MAIEQDLQVGSVLQIPDQGRVGDHGLEKAADGVVARSAASATPPITKESLHEVVGSLGLNEPRSVGSRHRDGIGEELVLVFVELLDQGLPGGAGTVIGAGSQLLAELLHGL